MLGPWLPQQMRSKITLGWFMCLLFLVFHGFHSKILQLQKVPQRFLDICQTHRFYLLSVVYSEWQCSSGGRFSELCAFFSIIQLVILCITTFSLALTYTFLVEHHHVSPVPHPTSQVMGSKQSRI